VFRLADGQVRELTEYLDTELVNQALEPPELNR
jgi:ketosteroid isomerase-like protein